MKCAICGKEVPPDDPTYPNVHYKCSDRFLKEMERLKVIKILSKIGIKVAYTFTASFKKVLDESLYDAHYYIITDETVDDDIIDMQGVIRASLKYLPEGTPPSKLFHCAELIFNSLMKIKYGTPVPNDKKFHSRVREFMEEVTSIPVSKQEAELFKALRRRFM